MSIDTRSEIVYLYDAINCNPNGDPIDPNGAPRIDEETDHCYVTDVRLKRYIRDQAEADDDLIYITQQRPADGESAERDEMFMRVLEGEYGGEWDDLVKGAGDVYDRFTAALDVRLFGATLSFEGESTEGTDLPQHAKGPVQFGIGRTLHPVEENYETGSLTSVIGTGEGKAQGGYDLADPRIKYGLIGFGGMVDVNNAGATNLAAEDVRRLDTLCWEAVKNQTLSRSKVGQQPRLYLRVEYTDRDFAIGGLDRDLSTVESDREAAAFRSIRDLTVDASDLLRRLRLFDDQTERLHVAVDDVVQLSLDGSPEDVVHGPEFVGELEEIASVEPIAVPGSIADRSPGGRDRNADEDGLRNEDGDGNRDEP
jgi:CRISPR-associated protein Csh2